MPKDYNEMIHALKQPFPAGTVQNSRYIPNQVYIDRLEQATESEWTKEILKVDIRPDLGYVSAVVRVKIQTQYRDGFKIETVPLNCEGTALNTAVDKVVNGAFVDAVDSWQVGWIDLVNYSRRDWADNPGITLLQHYKSMSTNNQPAGQNKPASSPRICVTCKKELNSQDMELLKSIPDQRIDYCTNCIPSHRLKKRRT